MIYTTFTLAREARACQSSYRKFAEHVGGVKKFGGNTPIPLTEIAEVLGLNDALWCLRCTQQPKTAERLARLLAADFAEHVLHFYEERYPGDKRPRKAIEAARLFAQGIIGDAARAAAGAAARAAAGDAAWDAARDAAWNAAGDAAWAAARDAARAAARSAAWAAAGAFAWDAAWAAAWAAAWHAAGAAAWAAEQEWQLNRSKEVLSE